jgi:hypothetical protein
VALETAALLLLLSPPSPVRGEACSFASRLLRILSKCQNMICKGRARDIWLTLSASEVVSDMVARLPCIVVR